jgi:hypothetical protein
MKTWQSKLKSPYTPEVGGAQARIDSLVKLLQRPSGCQDKFQLTDSLSMLAAVGFKIEAPFMNSLLTRVRWLKNIVKDNGSSLNDSGGGVTVFPLGNASNEGHERRFQKSKMNFLHFWDF